MKNRKITLALNRWKYHSKPSEKETYLDQKGNRSNMYSYDKETGTTTKIEDKYHTVASKLRSNLSYNTVTIIADELLQAAVKGQTYTIGAYHASGNGYARRAEANWKSQDIIGIDIDNGITPDDFLARCRKINMIPSFMYTTFSDSPKLRKFRAIFLLDETCTDSIKMKQGIYALTAVFGEADTHCTDLARYFYGGKEIIFTSDETINLDKLLEEHSDKIVSFTAPKAKGSKKRTESSKTESKESYTSPITMNAIVDYLNSDDFLMIRGKQYICLDDFIEEMKAVSLHKIFNVEQGKVFSCAFHDDAKPSAYISDKNKYVCRSEKCHMEHSHDIFDVISYILTGTLINSFGATLKFLCDELGVTVEMTEEQKDNYINVSDFLMTAMINYDDITLLEEEYPKLSERTMYCKSVYDTLVKQGMRVLLKQEQKGLKRECLVVLMSKAEIGKRCGYESEYQLTEGVRNRINDLCTMRFITQLTDDEVKEHSNNLYNSTIKLQRKKGANCTVNCYKLNKVTPDMYPIIEEAIKNKPTRRAQCKENMASRGTKSLQKGDGAIDETTSYFIALDKYVMGKSKKKKCVAVEEFEKKCVEFKVPGGAGGRLAHIIRDFLMNKYKLTEKKKASASVKAQYSLKDSLSSHKFVYCKKTK